MKTNIKIWKSALLGALVLTGCQKDSEKVQGDFTGEPIAVTAQTQEDGATRTTLNGFRTEWVAGDKIGVFSPQAGASNAPLTAASAGATSAFDGEMTWGTGAHDFYAYYPHVAGSFDHTAVPVSLPANQTQSSGGNSDHLAALDFMYAQPLTGVQSGGDVGLQFSHLFPLLEFRVLGTGRISKIEFTSLAENMVACERLSIDISNPSSPISSVAGWSNSATLTLTSPATLTENKATTPALYMMVCILNRNNLIDTDISVTTTIDGQEKVIKAEGFRMDSGKKYVLVVDPDKGITPPEPEDGVVIDGVKWATRNVGEHGTFATSPESYGNFYTREEALYACPEGWKMPTQDEFMSLRNSGSVWTTVNGVNGRRFGSGDNTIFLPAGGLKYSGNVIELGSSGYYWMTIPNDDSDTVFHITDEDGYMSWWNYTGNGSNIRCVEGSGSVTGVELFSTETIQKGVTRTLTATVLPQSAYNQNVTWESSNPAVATINRTTGEVTAVNEGTTTITVTTEEGGFSATGTLTVTSDTAAGSLSLLPANIDPNSILAEYTVSTDQWERLISSNFGFRNDMVEITKTVYSKFKDDFDGIFYVLNTPSNDEIINSLGFYGVNMSVSNDVQGIGTGVYSNSSYWGSAGRLKSVMYFPYDNAIVNGPALHELAHNWAAFIVPTYAPDNARYDGHWGISNAGGQLGGFNHIRTVEQNSSGVTGKTLYQASFDPDKNPDGSFKYGFGVNANGGNGLRYSDIELYLMGMKSAEELRDANFTLDIYSGNSYDQNTFGQGYFWSTTKTSYTIDDIIEQNGPRVPDAASSQKSFKILTVVLSQEGQTANNYAEIIKGVSWFAGGMDDATYGTGWIYNFQQATYGRGTLVVDGVKNSRKPQTRSGATRTAPQATPSLPDDYRDRIHIDRADEKLLAPER